MLLIVLGIVVIVLSVRWINKMDFYEKTFTRDTLIASACVTLGLFIAVIGFGAPFHGYNEPNIAEEYELCELVEDSGIYVIEDSNREPFFKYIAESYEDGVYSPYSDLDIEFVISNEYTTPKLVRYNIKPKVGVLSFGFFGYTTEYKIYLSEDHIKRFK